MAQRHYPNLNHEVDTAKWTSEVHNSRNSAKARKHAKSITNRKFRRTPIDMTDSGYELDALSKRTVRFDRRYGLKNMAFQY